MNVRKMLLMAMAIAGLTCIGSVRSDAQVAEIISIASKAIGSYFDKKGPQSVYDTQTKRAVNDVGTKIGTYNRSFNNYKRAFDSYSKEVEAIYQSADKFSKMYVCVVKAKECADLVTRIMSTGYEFSKFSSCEELSVEELEAILSYYQAIAEVTRSELNGTKQLYSMNGNLTMKDRYDLLVKLHDSLSTIYSSCLSFNRSVNGCISYRAGGARDARLYASMYKSSLRK